MCGTAAVAGSPGARSRCRVGDQTPAAIPVPSASAKLLLLAQRWHLRAKLRRRGCLRGWRGAFGSPVARSVTERQILFGLWDCHSPPCAKALHCAMLGGGGIAASPRMQRPAFRAPSFLPANLSMFLARMLPTRILSFWRFFFIIVCAGIVWRKKGSFGIGLGNGVSSTFENGGREEEPKN